MPRSFFGFFIVGFAGLFACDRAPSTSSMPAGSTSPPGQFKPELPLRLPAASRIVAIGDLHGDIDATRRALRLAGAIDPSDHWAGGKLVVVQTGDQLDRGDSDREILDLFDRLPDEAAKAGGAFVPLDGNHEVMNVSGDFRYVTSAGFLEFAGVPPPPPVQPLLAKFPEAARGRAAAFLPGGPYARLLAKRRVAVIVGSTLFVHGGVLPEHVRYDLGRMNTEVSRWMRGELAELSAEVSGPRAPIWVRDYGESSPDASACSALDAVLGAVDAARMVVGHTVQDGGVSSACGGKVWRIDVGLSSYYGRKPAQVLEISGDRVQPLVEGRGAPSASAPMSAPAPAVP
jgi:hypothetical protein